MLIISSPTLNPLVTNGHSHPYHLDESTFIFRGIRSILFFSFISFFDENHVSAKQNCPSGMPRFHIWDTSVCLCPIIKRTPGLYGIIKWFIFR